jgi:hypothetical protein
LRGQIEHSRHVIIESNSVIKFLQPDMYLTVLDPATKDFKTSAQQFLDRASAVILHENGGTTQSLWQTVSLKPVVTRPVFRIAPPAYVTPEIVNFVRQHMDDRSPEASS